ncbi:hypothetical protein L211DRAFT_678558 [Terfezia boudieri ATCC MYA-4762]|uniref:Uncharacterized protein n=1 Tax=Terfezia boudieri ATCC MYA-4762 TaxID=1051890 RepID=A0A3N4LU77_9PEZI|nr:hypothetical protein L211DRAFT_678558 [Terfezia boudieri ATCC MYA-4762]
MFYEPRDTRMTIWDLNMLSSAVDKKIPPQLSISPHRGYQRQLYEDWGSLDFGEDYEITITELHGLTSISNHHYLHEPCNYPTHSLHGENL